MLVCCFALTRTHCQCYSPGPLGLGLGQPCCYSLKPAAASYPRRQFSWINASLLKVSQQQSCTPAAFSWKPSLVKLRAAPVEHVVMEKKPMRNYHNMIAEALVELKGKEEGHAHAHGLVAIKHAIEAKHHHLPAHWEKRLSAAVKMMVDKHELVHVPSHPGMYKMSKAMEAKQARKTGPRKPKVEKKEKAATKAKAPAKKEKKAPAKAKHPAKRAKKADAKVKA